MAARMAPLARMRAAARRRCAISSGGSPALAASVPVPTRVSSVFSLALLTVMVSLPYPAVALTWEATAGVQTKKPPLLGGAKAHQGTRAGAVKRRRRLFGFGQSQIKRLTAGL